MRVTQGELSNQGNGAQYSFYLYSIDSIYNIHYTLYTLHSIHTELLYAYAIHSIQIDMHPTMHFGSEQNFTISIFY